MLDIKILRNDPNFVKNELKKRNFEFPITLFEDLEKIRKQTQTESEELQAKRKKLSQQIGLAKSKNENTDNLMQEVNKLSELQDKIEATFEEVQTKLNHLLSEIPNLPDPTTPIGNSEDDNVEIRRFGVPPKFDFTPKDHADLEDIGLSFDLAAKISGARFAVLSGDIARLHRALAQFMLNTHTQKNGYTEFNTPYLVNNETLFGSGQLPKFEDDLFKTKLGNRDFYLIPTAEVTLTNLVADVILDEKTLPLKMTAHTPCFRSEAGSAGRDVRGMIRQHQFEKVELVQITKPEDSDQALEEITHHAESILQALNLPYRVMQLCSGDMGFSAKKTYDLEVWLPGQNKYREISSCSNCGDFQARRMKARYKTDDKKTTLVHTLNGSGLAVGRTLVAVLENYQQADGSIIVPDVLIPYMGGTSLIKKVK